ncbi:MAG TPA: hypothetical protein VD860_10450 [Azospirillum sp.]|nr:hypothetical protein [Azospirillum sp.]
MRGYRSFTTQRLLDLDARLAAMGRTRAVMERRLAGELRALRVVLVLWALTLAGVAAWVAG